MTRAIRRRPAWSVWQFGLAFMPIMPEHYWASVVEAAKKAGDTAQRIEALFAHVPEGEPTVNGFTFRKWEPGAFFENEAVPNFFQTGTVVTQFAKRRLDGGQRAARLHVHLLW